MSSPARKQHKIKWLRGGKLVSFLKFSNFFLSSNLFYKHLNKGSHGLPTKCQDFLFKLLICLHDSNSQRENTNLEKAQAHSPVCSDPSCCPLEVYNSLVLSLRLNNHTLINSSSVPFLYGLFMLLCTLPFPFKMYFRKKSLLINVGLNFTSSHSSVCWTQFHWSTERHSFTRLFSYKTTVTTI